MSENRGSRQPQRYCRNCGAELRPGTAFCTSCGAGLGPTPIASGPQTSRTDSQGRTGSPAGAWRHGPSVDALRRLPGRAARWLRALPVVPKLALLGVGLLALLAFLSPVTYVLAAIACVVSLVVLAVRAFQRRPVMGWVVAAATSLVLALALGGVSSALYGPGSSESGRGGGSAYPTNSGGNAANSSAGGRSTDGYSYQYDAASAGVDAAFDEMIEGYRSEGSDFPLLLPTYVPFAIDGVSVDPFGRGDNAYYVWSDVDNQFANHLRVEMLSAEGMPAEYMAQDTVTIDGEEYLYTENTTEPPQEGQYTVILWVNSVEGEEIIYYVELNYLTSPLPYEEFVETVTAMERLDPSDV
jgi:hypothetical protein